MLRRRLEQAADALEPGMDRNNMSDLLGEDRGTPGGARDGSIDESAADKHHGNRGLPVPRYVMSATADDSVWPFLEFLSQNCPLLRRGGSGGQEGGEKLTRQQREEQFVLEQISKRGKSKPRFL